MRHVPSGVVEQTRMKGNPFERITPSLLRFFCNRTNDDIEKRKEHIEPTVERYELKDQTWAQLEPLLPGKEGDWGGTAKDNRKFVDAIMWILKTDAPWRELPAEYGNWNSVAKRFRRLLKNGTLEKVLEQLVGDPEYEWLMSAADRANGAPVQRYLWPWMRLVCRSESLLQKIPRQILNKVAG